MSRRAAQSGKSAVRKSLNAISAKMKITGFTDEIFSELAGMVEARLIRRT